MEQNYTPRPPRLCPGCGSAVADGFDNCPTCGYAMPAQQSPNPAPKQPPLVTPTYPQGQGYYPYDIPAGATIVSDRKTYFAHYMPRQQYNGIAVAAVVSLIFALVIGAIISFGGANNTPVLFLFHTVAATVLAFWLLEQMDIASSVTSLIYTVIFFFVSLAVFDHAYFYPIICSAIALSSVAKGNQNWKAYRARPIPMAALTEDDVKSFQKKKRGYRIAIIILAVILLAASVLMFVFKNEENAMNEGYTVGEVNGNTYENDFAGISFTTPEDWYLLNEDELENYNVETFMFQYDPETYATIMYAVHADDASNLDETYEYVIVYATKHGRKALADDYFDSLKKEWEDTDTYFDFSVTSKELDSVEMGELTYRVLNNYYVGENGENFHEYILVATKGCYTFEIYLYPEGNTTYEDLLSCFGNS